jgi:type III secretion system FlhB-like substrate exporter
MVITLTEERKGQIALAILKQAASESSTSPRSEEETTEGIEELEYIYRKIPTELGISFGEILSFFRELTQDQDKEIFDRVAYRYGGPADTSLS